MSSYLKMKMLGIYAVGLLFMPMAHALSLGDINVYSALNDPLDAEITVHATDAAEILNLRIKLASHEVHDKAGLSINQHLLRMTFKSVVTASGKFSIRVTTLRPVTEPVLEFIIEVSGGGTNLLRGYAFHLDPPNL